ncbi:bifunctional riboflavin kinase/FAD synthetase [Sulfurospirillum oryzae]|uniref:bifunctional riboflavin kinase/FAD synthetase n=1 Tax=Sulfurospirillum oryzae TaxID=2976535 RepID=UPI0021E7FB5B|nr:bifunctional riboflavin kinase/FAD synthetase [Sulfurospirillum oryzae]
MLRRSTILKKESVDALAIGSFDGIHVGHRQLINHLGENGALFVIDKDQANLTPGIKRSEYAGYPCMFFHFLKIKHLSGAEFVELLKKEFINLKKIVVGYDFFFGAHRSCNAYDLQKFFDGEVIIVEEYSYKGVSIHSSVIRSYLQEGRLSEANRFLGREYAITGDVITGQGLGNKELVPTLNLKVLEYLIPREGVYATRTKIAQHIYNSVSFIGTRHTTDGQFSVETHILDETISEIQGAIELFFVEFLRDNQKFNTLLDLKIQIEQDIKEARKHLFTCKVYLSDFL